MPFSEDALGNETLWFLGLGCPRGALGKDLSLASSREFIGCRLSGPLVMLLHVYWSPICKSLLSWVTLPRRLFF